MARGILKRLQLAPGGRMRHTPKLTTDGGGGRGAVDREQGGFKVPRGMYLVLE